MFSRWRPWALVGALAVSLVAPGISADSKKETKRKIVSAQKVDESLDHIDVFEGIESGLLDVKMIPKDAMGGNMLIENKSDKPLNVDFPAAFIGKQVLKQGLAGGGGGAGGQSCPRHVSLGLPRTWQAGAHVPDDLSHRQSRRVQR